MIGYCVGYVPVLESVQIQSPAEVDVFLVSEEVAVEEVVALFYGIQRAPSVHACRAACREYPARCVVLSVVSLVLPYVISASAVVQSDAGRVYYVELSVVLEIVFQEFARQRGAFLVLLGELDKSPYVCFCQDNVRVGYDYVFAVSYADAFVGASCISCVLVIIRTLTGNSEPIPIVSVFPEPLLVIFVPFTIS